MELKCPINGTPLVFVSIINVVDEGIVATYASLDINNLEYKFTKSPNSPFYKVQYSDIDNPWRNIHRYFLLSEGCWIEYERHTSWNIEGIYLPLETPHEAIFRIKEAVGDLYSLYVKSSTASISSDLISVQPMSAPTANIFYMDYVYQPTKK